MGGTEKVLTSGEVLKKYNIAYLCHGERHFLEETYFSILSLCNQTTKIQYKIHIYTNQPNFFESLEELDIDFHLLNKEKISDWKGKNQFIDRLKVKVIMDQLLFNDEVAFMS